MREYSREILKRTPAIIRHLQKVIREAKGKTQSQLYRALFLDKEVSKKTRGDILETWGADILRAEIFGKYPFKSLRCATADEDRVEHMDALGYMQDNQRGGVQYANSGSVKIHGAEGIENKILFLAQPMDDRYQENNPPGLYNVLVTTAPRENCSQVVSKLGNGHRLFAREEHEHLVSVANIKQHIQYLKDSMQHFKDNLDQDLTIRGDKHPPHDYQLTFRTKIGHMIKNSNIIDLYIRIGQGGGKTRMQKDYMYQAFKEGDIAIIVLPTLGLMEQSIEAILPDIIVDNNKKPVECVTFSSRRHWKLMNKGYDIICSGALEKLTKEEADELFSTRAKVCFTTYHQLENLLDKIEEYGLGERLWWLFDEIASKAPKVEHPDKDNVDPKHWEQIKRITDKGLYKSKTYFDANYPDSINGSPVVGALLEEFNIPQSELVNRGITVPIIPYVIDKTASLPKEIMKIKGLTDLERRNVAGIMKVIQVRVELYESEPLVTQDPGIIYWNNAKNCGPVSDFIAEWVQEQNFDVKVNIAPYTSYVKSKDKLEQTNTDWRENTGINILMSKRMLNRGINFRRCRWEIMFDICQTEEATHRFTRINRADDRDIIGEPKKYKTHGDFYYVNDDAAEHTRKVLKQLVYADLQIPYVVIDEKGSGTTRKIPINELMKGDPELAKQVEGTSIANCFNLIRQDIKAEFEANRDAKLQSIQTAKELNEWFDEEDVVA